MRVAIIEDEPEISEIIAQLCLRNGHEICDPLNSKDIARQIIFALKQPSHCNIDEILVMPTVQGAATKVFRTQ